MTRLRTLLTLHWRWLFVFGAYALVVLAATGHVWVTLP